MENLFSFNLDVLSLDLYGWRSLEATVRIRLKARGRRPKSENLRTPENAWIQGLSIDKSSTKRLHTYTETKLHPRANKFQSKTYWANSPTKQEHNPEHKNTGGQKSHQTHKHLKTHYWTLFCTPERSNPAVPTRTPTQAFLTRKPLQVTHPTPPQGRTSTIKRNHKLQAYRKATQNTAT